MNTKLIFGLALVLSSVSVIRAEETNSLVTTNAPNYRRISSAEVENIRLEVEQIGSGEEVQFRVRDYAARNYGKKEAFCDLHYISKKGKDDPKPFVRVALKQVAPGSDDYSGSFTNNDELDHGVKFRAVYKSDGLALPISTWYACYYH